MNPATDRPQPRASARIPELDGLRGIAILFVLLWHYLGVFAHAPHRSLLALGLCTVRLAWSGVDLFFVLSGFLIGGILIDARKSADYFATFYRRRFFRIAPLYAAVCAVFWIGVRLGGASWRGAAGHWLFADPLPWYAFPLFIQNFFMAGRGTFDPLSMGVTWSLAVEEQFYLTLPLLVRFLRPRTLVRVLLIVVVASPVLRAAAFYGLPHGGVAAYVLTPMRADGLVAGVLGAVLLRSPEGRALLVRRRRALEITACALAASTLGFVLLGATDNTSALMSTVGYSWLAALYGSVLVLAVSGPSSRLSALLRTRWLRWVGEIAYGTYLLHVAVLGACFALVFGREPHIRDRVELGVALLAAALTFVLARLSWTLFERPLMRMGASRPERQLVRRGAGRRHLHAPVLDPVGEVLRVERDAREAPRAPRIEPRQA